MSDTSNNPDRQAVPKPSITVVLAIALAISLAFSSHLLLRSDVRAVIFSPVLGETVSAAPEQTTPTSTPTLVSTDINSLVAQLQEMQSQMQAASAQLEQKYQAASSPSSIRATRGAVVEEDITALWAEIEQLNQQMLPLMNQLEAASANRSSRPASEWFALRTKVNTIHMRLADLTARVQAAQARANAGTGAGAAQWVAPAGSAGTVTDPNQASYEQLYQNMLELQHLLDQMQGNHPAGR